MLPAQQNPGRYPHGRTDCQRKKHHYGNHIGRKLLIRYTTCHNGYGCKKHHYTHHIVQSRHGNQGFGNRAVGFKLLYDGKGRRRRRSQCDPAEYKGQIYRNAVYGKQHRKYSGNQDKGSQ